ncbi:MAG: hypothetical protein JWM74_4259 [Myxococcaceae bacterium]|nr:hypothetical protein [Myxococcaceae bacterium]
MSRLSLAALLILAGCTKPAPPPATASADTTVDIPTASDAGASPKAATTSAPAADPDPLSLEPRGAVDAPDECRGSCNAKIGAALTRDLSERAKKTHRCYERALAADPTLHGRLVIAMRISKDGAPCAVTVVKNDLLTSNVSECVVNVMKSARYAPPESHDDCAAANIPISFVPISDAGTKP